MLYISIHRGLYCNTCRVDSAKMDIEDTGIPVEFKHAPEIGIKRVDVSQLNQVDFQEPLLILGFTHRPFHRFSSDSESVVKDLLDVFSNDQVPLTSGETILLGEWYRNKKGRYVKDWHINAAARSKGILPFFETPPELPDWLNQFCLARRAEKLDFQFLYWGDNGTSTPYHEDVAGTFSWSYNLRGRKLWNFFLTVSEQPTVASVIQNPGEMVFVPSGCFHKVQNLDNDTISINQNWFNSHNLPQVTMKIVDDSLDAKRRFDMFKIPFASPEEEMQQIEFVVMSNNDLNATALLDIISFKLDSDHALPFGDFAIIDAVLQDFRRIPQFPLVELKLLRLVEVVSSR
jgi:hypothetical protein